MAEKWQVKNEARGEETIAFFARDFSALVQHSYLTRTMLPILHLILPETSVTVQKLRAVDQ